MRYFLFVAARFTFLAGSKGPFHAVIRAPLTADLGLHMLLVRTSSIAAKITSFRTAARAALVLP